MVLIASPIRFPAPSTVEKKTTGSSIQNSNGITIAGPSNPAQLFQPYYLRPAYRFKSNMPRDLDLECGPGRRLRKNVANVRRHIDYVATVINHVQDRKWQKTSLDRTIVQPDILYQNSVLPPSSTKNTPVDCILTKFVRSAMNKVKCPIYSICWTPEGKRLITGASTGEFTLWNGTAFNFETILQAHDTAIRALRWSHNDQWLVSADHDGFVKYWQPNMNNVHMYQAHKNEPIRCLSFSPTDVKLATASDDGTARVWDFTRCTEERILRGHGSDVRTVDWHPQKGLLVTGSRDSQQPVKIWDPKTGVCLATLHDHKNSVMSAQWNQNGNWLITGSRDHLIKLYDIRMMKEMRTYRGHKKEVTSLAWHPVHEGMFVSGGGDGSLAYWLADNDKEVGLLEHAHEQAVWTLEWHPLGHILATGSNDNNTKFWARNRPGDTQEDIFGLTSFSSSSASTTPMTVQTDKVEDKAMLKTTKEAIIPGMGLDSDTYHQMNRDVVTGQTLIPGLGGGPLLFPDDPNPRQQQKSGGIGAKRTLIKQPPPKRAQRQFERMWNVAKPGGGADDGDDDFSVSVPRADVFQRHKSSLLGPAPPPLEMAPPQQMMQQSSGAPPPQPQPPPPPPPRFIPPAPQWNSTPFVNNRPPPIVPQLGPMWQISRPPPPFMHPRPPLPPSLEPICRDIDYRNDANPDVDVDLRPASANIINESESWRIPNTGGVANTRDPRLRSRTDNSDHRLNVPVGENVVIDRDPRRQAKGNNTLDVDDIDDGRPLNPKRKWQDSFESEQRFEQQNRQQTSETKRPARGTGRGARLGRDNSR